MSKFVVPFDGHVSAVHRQDTEFLFRRRIRNRKPSTTRHGAPLFVRKISIWYNLWSVGEKFNLYSRCLAE